MNLVWMQLLVIFIFCVCMLYRSHKRLPFWVFGLFEVVNAHELLEVDCYVIFLEERLLPQILKSQRFILSLLDFVISCWVAQKHLVLISVDEICQNFVPVPALVMNILHLRIRLPPVLRTAMGVCLFSCDLKLVHLLFDLIHADAFLEWVVLGQNAH